MLRRNGKLRSCEPCRISKIKCDHATPTCAKCQTRGVADQCFYHPNPMTKPAGTPRKKPEPRRRKADARNPIGQSPQGHDRLSSLTLSPPTLRNHVGTVPLNNSFPSPPDSTTRPTPAVGGSTRGFYLGSTSYASVFMEDRPLPDTLHDQPSERTSMTPAPPSLGTRHCQMDVAHSIVSKLTPFSFYEKLVVSYFAETWASALIGPLVTSCLPQLAEDIRKLTSPGTNVYEEYARITKNTAKPLKISSTVLPSDFHTLITGENLRWETMGMILTLAVCNAQMMSPDDPMFILDAEKKVDRDQFVEDMIQVSNDCINLCQIHGACSDIMVWLLYCNLCIVSGHYGDNYHGAWRRLGDIVSSLYAAGIHCENESAATEAVFLRETRRRVYASVYWQDKLLAMFFGRPPLMAWRYSDRKQLLDVSDVAISSGDPVLMDEEISKLGVGGWNTEGKVHPASYLRLRCQHAVFKERILEQSLAGEKDEDVVANLQTIASELTDFWQSVPCHMRYDAYKEHGAWTAIGESITVRLITAYLEYLHTHFQVQRMLYRRTQDALPALLHVAFKLLSCAVFATKPDRSYAIRRQVPTMILMACFPAAGVLALELRRCTLEGTSLPNTVSRADIIRNLSVLTSCLEWIYLPGDGNLKLCSELNKMLATVLDEVLNYQPPVLSDQASNGAPPMAGTGNAFFDMPLMDGMEPIPTESGDFLNWLDNTTWSNNVSLF